MNAIEQPTRITEWARYNAPVATTRGSFPYMQWLESERQRIGINVAVIVFERPLDCYRDTRIALARTDYQFPSYDFAKHTRRPL